MLNFLSSLGAVGVSSWHCSKYTLASIFTSFHRQLPAAHLSLWLVRGGMWTHSLGFYVSIHPRDYALCILVCKGLELLYSLLLSRGGTQRVEMKHLFKQKKHSCCLCEYSMAPPFFRNQLLRSPWWPPWWAMSVLQTPNLGGGMTGTRNAGPYRQPLGYLCPS